MTINVPAIANFSNPEEEIYSILQEDKQFTAEETTKFLNKINNYFRVYNLHSRAEQDIYTNAKGITLRELRSKALLAEKLSEVPIKHLIVIPPELLTKLCKPKYQKLFNLLKEHSLDLSEVNIGIREINAQQREVKKKHKEIAAKKSMEVTSNPWGDKELHLTIPYADAAIELESRIKQSGKPAVLFLGELLENDSNHNLAIAKVAEIESKLELTKKALYESNNKIAELEILLSNLEEIHYSPQTKVNSDVLLVPLTDIEKRVINFVEQNGNTELIYLCIQFFENMMQTKNCIDKLVARNILKQVGDIIIKT